MVSSATVPRFVHLSLAALLALTCHTGALAQDLDRDGLADALEQALLERFLPTFVLSAGECAGLPASFVPDVEHPRVQERDGTIYGHVSLRSAADATPVEIEIKYFHLWARDCGRPSHALDVERVSALVSAPSRDAPMEDWQAQYWYAAAHEGTVCDAGSGARATALRAETVGPFVYVSRGKHASYLNRGHCKWGCGSDRCDPGTPLVRAGVVNLGELDHPMNGATWITSRRWSLATKLSSDFDGQRRTRLDGTAPWQVLALRVGLRPFQAPILGSDTGLDALVIAGEAALTGVSAASSAVDTAVSSSARATGKALGRTFRAITRVLRP